MGVCMRVRACACDCLNVSRGGLRGVVCGGAEDVLGGGMRGAQVQGSKMYLVSQRESVYVCIYACMCVYMRVFV